ncbi:hypothetical protein [Granulosicoccus antarcticus]|nr:hypothetical protein [Granulosicoccus antarcticus]
MKGALVYKKQGVQTGRIAGFKLLNTSVFQIHYQSDTMTCDTLSVW